MLNAFIYKSTQLLRRMGVRFGEEHDPRVQAMRETIGKLGSVQFRIEVAEDGSWVAESTNIDGIMTGGTQKERINEHLKDAVFTYFEIPPHLCNDALIKTQGEPLQLQQRLYA